MKKSDLQKTIKALRDSMSYGNFPKAMMTFAQEKNNTATVNCGYDYNRKDQGLTAKTANEIMDHSDFKAMILRNNATASLEYSGQDIKQIRINW